MTTASPSLPQQRTAVITGAASERGIGRATVERLARAGWAIAIIDLDGEASERAAREVSATHGVPAVGIGASVTSEKDIDRAVTTIEESLPPVVGLVNVAGVSSPTPFLELTAAEWDRVLDVNIRGIFLVTRRVMGSMVEAGIGRVVSVSSASAQMGGGTYSKVPYSASKAAVIGFTRALAREVGPLGVTVNCVSPGPIDTDIMGGTLTDSRRAELVSGLLVDRLGQPDDIAATIAHLMSDDAGYIQGACYDVNGGLWFS